MNNVIIQTVPQEEKLFIHCDQNQLKQVFINLIKNAIDSMPKGGAIQLRSEKAEGFIFVHVKDEGEEYLKKP